MSRTTCRQRNNHGFVCHGPGVFRVWWQATGDDETTACALHVAKAIRIYQQAHPGDTIKTRALDC